MLELLSDLTKHPKLAIQAQQAIDRVLDSNLSAKYWQCGQLKHSDVIKDGFFDAGQVTQRLFLSTKTLISIGLSWREAPNPEGATPKTITAKSSCPIR